VKFRRNCVALFTQTPDCVSYNWIYRIK